MNSNTFEIVRGLKFEVTIVDGTLNGLKWELENPLHLAASLSIEERVKLLEELQKLLNLPPYNYVQLIQAAVRRFAPLIYTQILRGSGENAKDILNKYLGTTFAGDEDIGYCVAVWIKKLMEKEGTSNATI